MKELYENQSATEIWNDTTIMSILKQVSFYSEMGLLKYRDITMILEELKKILEELETKTAQDPKFHIYVNDLVILNNSILFKNEHQSSFFVPFNMFGYMMTNDEATCEDTLTYFEHQIKNSKSLSSSGNRDRKIFFIKMNEQIDTLMKKLESYTKTTFKCDIFCVNFHFLAEV